ncbi:MAG: DEAD/DEAH box helicase family protein, partial [Fusobacteriaceae bacterium]
VIIDKNICQSTYLGAFSYREYTNQQNQLMKKYKYLYRFLETELKDNRERISKILVGELEIPPVPKKNIVRNVIDASYLEHHFEKVFFGLYGENSYNLLTKEKGIIGFSGENIFADYVIEKKDEKIVIEENGENYHHPQKTGEERYRKQIERQNALIYQGYKVFRFSKNEIEFQDRMVEEMEIFFGKAEEFIPQNRIDTKREFQLYEHQEITLENLKRMREEGVKSALIVQPTGTGKSRIAIEDMEVYLRENKEKKILVISPTRALRQQWIKNILENITNISVGESEDNQIIIVTQNWISRKKNRFHPEEFGYIVVDEAHHSVADEISKTIKYFNPQFLFGMTATPDRNDKKKMEEIFSTVETKLTLKEAIEKKICCAIRVFRLESNISLSEVRFNGKEYTAGDLEKKIVVESRNTLIADTLEKYFGSHVEELGEKQGVIFCVNIRHCEIMAKLLNSRGINARAVSGNDSESEKYLKEYLDGKVRFICSCQLLSEGWDAPKTSIIVMARPTMSKVLYYQQLGRGTRRAEGKEALYVVDVVDNYGFNAVPWSTNAVFNNPFYAPFRDVISGKIDFTGELIHIDYLLEREKNLVEVDIETFQKKYGHLISVEELARELFISNGTVNSWVKKGDITPDYTLTLGRNKYYKFEKEKIEIIRISKKLKHRTKETIGEDFWEFIGEKDYTFSYKIVFVLSFLKNLMRDGEADFQKIKSTYVNYYKKRLENNLHVDKKGCPYTSHYLDNDKDIIRNIINNPFEKFERKRFIYHSADLKNIGFSYHLWEKLDKNSLKKLKLVMMEDLKKYYENLGGEGDTSELL